MEIPWNFHATRKQPGHTILGNEPDCRTAPLLPVKSAGPLAVLCVRVGFALSKCPV